jgi:hypothetical protein
MILFAVFPLFFLLFVHCVFINILTVIWISVCCNDRYGDCCHDLHAQNPPQQSTVRKSAAQTVDGNLRVVYTQSFLSLGATLGGSDDDNNNDDNNKNNGNLLLSYQYTHNQLDTKLRHGTHHVWLLSNTHRLALRYTPVQNVTVQFVMYVQCAQHYCKTQCVAAEHTGTDRHSTICYAPSVCTTLL